MFDSETYYQRVDLVRSLSRGRSCLWSAVEDGNLRALYPDGEWSDIEAALPGRSKGAIQQRAHRLSITRDCAGRPYWTAREERFLRARYGIAGWDEIRSELSRHTVGAIRFRAQSLGLWRPEQSKRRARYPIMRDLRDCRRAAKLRREQLAETIGCSKTQLARWEWGLANPHFSMLVAWANALGFELALVKAAR